MKNEKYFSVPKTQPRNTLSRPIIPVGPYFQADLPILTTREAYKSDDTTTRCLGTKVWPLENIDLPNLLNIKIDPIGKGRDTNVLCTCQIPGSSKCIMKHVIEKKLWLKSELGSAYSGLGFNLMGEEASKNLSTMQKIRLDSIETKKAAWKDKGGFVKTALQFYPNLGRETIVRYYFNVIVSERIGSKIRNGLSPMEIYTEGEEEESTKTSTSSSVGSSHSSKKPKVARVKRYLNQRR